jgi:hypothetical protein
MTPGRSCAPRVRHEAAGAERRGRIATAFIVASLLSCAAASAAPPAPCDLRLVVGLTPDVPDPRDIGFLSSLVGNHPNYALTLTQQRDGSVIVVELTGPGPEYACETVVDAMRKDGRVMFVHVRQGLQ